MERAETRKNMTTHVSTEASIHHPPMVHRLHGTLTLGVDVTPHAAAHRVAKRFTAVE